MSKNKEKQETITVRRDDGILVCASIHFFSLAGSKRKVTLDLVNKLAPGHKLIFVGCSKRDEKSNPKIKEELETLYEFLSKNQKYFFHCKGNGEKKDSGVLYAPI